MGRRLITIFICLLIVNFISGTITIQTPTQATAMTEINAIKSQPELYIFAESTCSTWEEALDNAQYLLGAEIELWFRNQNKEISGYVVKAQKSMYGIQSMRGERYRAFLYVKKEDIMPYNSDEQLVVIPVNGDKGTSVKKVEGTPAASAKPKVVQPQESPVVPKVETIPQLSPLEKEMMTITDANNIGAYIKRLSSENKVKAYGKYSDMPSDIECYLFVYNRDLQIPAYLHKKGSTFINLKTGEKDYMSNYKGCGAYWFQLK